MKRGLILILLLFPLVQAVGVTPSSLNLDFKPNLQQEVQFNFIPTNSNTNIGVSLTGDLQQYASLDKTFLKNGGTVTVTINLPSSLEPGFHFINVHGSEQLTAGGGISAGTGITAPMRIFVPYEGKYIESSLEIQNINHGEEIGAKITIKNVGTKSIESLYTDIAILSNEQEVKKVRTEKISLKTTEKTIIEKKIPSLELKQGNYKAQATIHFDNNKEILEREFLVGELTIEITNYTKEAKEHEINKFVITLESKWNNKIENIVANVTLKKDKNVLLETVAPTISLEPWEKKDLETFLDLSSIDADLYDITLQLKYQDKIALREGNLNVRRMFNRTYIISIGIVILMIISSIIWYRMLKKTEKKRKNAKGN